MKITTEHIALLGQIPDARIAEACGCSRERVRQLRKKRGIPKHKLCTIGRAVKELRSKEALTDKEMADKLRVKRSLVAFARKKENIPMIKEERKYDGLADFFSLHTLTELADRFETTPCDMRGIAIRYGYTWKRVRPLVKRVPWSKMGKEELAEIFASHTVKELMEIFECSNAAISQLCKRYGYTYKNLKRGRKGGKI